MPRCTSPSSPPCRSTSPRLGSPSSSTFTFWWRPSPWACGTASRASLTSECSVSGGALLRAHVRSDVNQGANLTLCVV
jgi:hypothetical protein